jgi:hypothetical protein
MAVAIESMPYGLPITLAFIKANVTAAAGTYDMTFDQLGTGWKVPTGCVFHPMCLSITKVGTLDANATITAKVIYDGTELINGPAPALDQADSDTHITALCRLGVEPAAAGVVVGVSLTTDADYSTTATIDYDCHLVGVLTVA